MQIYNARFVLKTIKRGLDAAAVLISPDLGPLLNVTGIMCCMNIVTVLSPLQVPLPTENILAFYDLMARMNLFDEFFAMAVVLDP